MATTDGGIDVVEGIRIEVVDVPGTHTEYKIIRVTEGNAQEATSVFFKHPAVRGYIYEGQNPIEDGHVQIGKKSYYGEFKLGNISTEVALGVAKACELAHERNQEVLEQLQDKAAEKIARFKEEEQRRAEREKKRAEYREKLQVVRAKEREIEEAWRLEFIEAIRWYEGQAGRLKRFDRKQWDVFHELGSIAQGGRLSWMWNYQWYGDHIKNVQKLEIRYESERQLEKIELPLYPQDKIDEVRKELEGLERPF